MLWSAIRGASQSSPFYVSLIDINHQRNAGPQKVYPKSTVTKSINVAVCSGAGEGLVTIGTLTSTCCSHFGFPETPSP
jgi:hypothetical protein